MLHIFIGSPKLSYLPLFPFSFYLIRLFYRRYGLSCWLQLLGITLMIMMDFFMKLSKPSSLSVGCSDNWEKWGVYKGRKEQKFPGMGRVGRQWQGGYLVYFVLPCLVTG